jgi:hypothetical protein
VSALGALYFMLPGLVIALAVGYGLAVSYRTKHRYVAVLIWLAIIVLAALLGRAFGKDGAWSG